MLRRVYKTLFALQIAIAVASGHALGAYYRVLLSGAVLVIEQDDPAAAASVKDVLRLSPVPFSPYFLAPRVPYTFGLEFLQWLEGQIRQRDIAAAVIPRR